jgi:hypothetical protein
MRRVRVRVRMRMRMRVRDTGSGGGDKTTGGDVAVWGMGTYSEVLKWGKINECSRVCCNGTLWV